MRPHLHGPFVLIIRFFLFVPFVLFVPFISAAEPRDLSWFLRRMRSVEHLPELERSHTALSSTWDRTGGNRDDADFKDLRIGGPGEATANVLLDVDGPGCIHRIFVGTLDARMANTRIQIFLDGAPQPVFDLPIVQFFDDRHGPLPYPLVFHKSYPGTLFPIPFARHCRIQLVNPGYGRPGWTDAAWSNYWQVTYTRYEPATKVVSLRWPLSGAESAELDATCRAWLNAESNPPPVPARWTVEKTAALAPGEAFTVALPGTGVIRQLRVHVDPARPEALRALRIRARWDGAAFPSVDVPVGFFFGNLVGGYGKTLESKVAQAQELPPPAPPGTATPAAYDTRFNSLLLGVTSEDAYCCFPMPFVRGATLMFSNTGTQPLRSVRVRLAAEPLASLPDNWGRFHATWTAEAAATLQTRRTGPWHVPVKTVLQRSGRGKYVGVMLSIDWPFEGWWGEGDWQIWSDQEGWPPDYHGTGSEEYFNSGWCRFDRKAVSGFVTLRPGRPTVYSFHLNDAFQFQRNIRVVEEEMGNPDGGGARWLADHHPEWATTAFWYALPAQPAGSD